ncbi:solute carrier family 35 member C2 isoform 5-T6 [Spheniscus humboldti]
MAGVGGAALGRAALLVLLYYGFSIGIVFYNKWLMKSFPFPLLATLLHLLLIFGLSALARALARCRSGRPRAALSWADCLRWAAPAALSTSLDIGLSNWSFLYVTVSLYTMTKSSAILFILLFSLLFKLEEVRVALLLVVLLIAGGLFMFTYKSTQFNAQGFVLVLCASFLGGIRWTLTQILMQKADLGLQNPIDIMFHLQPLMFLGLFPLFAVFEGNLHFIPRHTFAGRPPQSFELAGLCCLSVRNLPSCHSQSHEFQRMLNKCLSCWQSHRLGTATARASLPAGTTTRFPNCELLFSCLPRRWRFVPTSLLDLAVWRNACIPPLRPFHVF